MKCFIYCLILSYGLFSCSEKESGLLTLDKAVELKAIEYDNEIITSGPLDIQLIDNNLFLFEPTGENAVLILDPESGATIGTWGLRGNGPGEFMYPMPWGINKKTKTIQLFDINRYTLRKYQYENKKLNLTEELRYENKQSTVRYATTLENGNIVASVIYGNKKPLLLLSSQLDSLYNWGEIPDEQYQSNDLRDYYGYLDSYRNTFVFAMARLGYVACYEQNGTNVPKKKWERFLEYPVYKGNKLDREVLKKGFSDIIMTPRHIFCSYSGEKYDNNRNIQTKNILVFDHNGKLVQNFHLDNPIGSITVSEDEKILYAISYEPEIRVVKYNIGDYL